MSANPVAVTAEIDMPGNAKLVLISNVKVLGAGAETYKVAIDFSQFNAPGMDFTYDYSDRAEFEFTVSPDDD